MKRKIKLGCLLVYLIGMAIFCCGGCATSPSETAYNQSHMNNATDDITPIDVGWKAYANGFADGFVETFKNFFDVLFLGLL